MFDAMKKYSYLLLFFAITVFSIPSCKKDSLITSGGALLQTSTDTLHFDTVFTGAGSITQSFKIFNLNNQKLRISNISLSGGNGSYFKMNVNGSAGASFSDIDIAANDSIYVFVSVTASGSASSLPFFIQDSILINYNGNNKYVQLDGYGQNAHFFKDAVIENDTIWTGDLPFVILGSLTVNENKKLTVEKGTKIYLHADAPFYINGSLQINGEADNRVLFTGDRLDDPYKNFPASWPGIIFSKTSTGNILNNVSLLNATQAITINGDGTGTQLNLNGCIINNGFKEGIIATNSSINAVNCLITNCGENNLKLMGGRYNFTHSTVASYSNILISHNGSVLYVSNQDDSLNQYTLDASFVNSIFYGDGGLVDDEVLVSQTGSSANISFQNVLYKAISANTSLFTNSINNVDPAFAILDFENTLFDFHLTNSSPCIDTGTDTGISTDLDGNPRNASLNNPDIGCYELQ